VLGAGKGKCALDFAWKSVYILSIGFTLPRLVAGGFEKVILND
jgi:hypothetical protein